MNIALLGNGKTGSRVNDLADGQSGISVTVFNRSRPPERNLLAEHDVIISFLPGDAFAEYIPELIASGKPVVSGSTGFDWPDGREDFSRRIAGAGLVWIHASNFSLGMNLIHEMIQIMGMAATMYDEHRFSIHDIHHAQKKDAPSGTALAWKRWLDQPATITSERTGDVVGQHTLTLDTPFEKISIHHMAKDRQIFASGALWTASRLLSDQNRLEPGLYDIQQFVLRHIQSRN